MIWNKPAHGLRLLVVDDDADILDALGSVLQDEGHAVRTAADGAEALATLKADEPPDLILLDLMMPVMDGWTLLRHMRNDPRLHSIPVVVMSAAGARAKSSIPESLDFLSKPLDLRRLLDAVHHTASRHGLESN